MTLVFYHSLFYFTKYNYNAFPTQISDCFFIIMNTRIYVDDKERGYIMCVARYKTGILVQRI